MDDFQQYLDKQLENEEFRKEYESLKTEHLNDGLSVNPEYITGDQKK